MVCNCTRGCANALAATSMLSSAVVEVHAKCNSSVVHLSIKVHALCNGLNGKLLLGSLAKRMGYLGMIIGFIIPLRK